MAKQILTNNPNGGYYVKIDDNFISSMSNFNLNLLCSDHSSLKLTILNPEIDLVIGNYHITSNGPENIFGKPYQVKNLTTNKIIQCQTLYFDGDMLEIGISRDQLEVDEKDRKRLGNNDNE